MSPSRTVLHIGGTMRRIALAAAALCAVGCESNDDHSGHDHGAPGASSDLKAPGAEDRLTKIEIDLANHKQGQVYTYEQRVRTVLHGLGFKPDDYQRPLAQLSGGQKTRALLGRFCYLFSLSQHSDPSPAPKRKSNRAAIQTRRSIRNTQTRSASTPPRRTLTRH